MILAVAAALTAWASWAFYASGTPSSVVNSSVGETFVYPLSEDRELPIRGAVGTTTVHIHGGKASIVDSPCKNKTCVQSGQIYRSGEWVACLPNGVFVRIEGEQHGADQLDAVVR